MSLDELVRNYMNRENMTIVAIIVCICLTLIQISPIKINPWSAISKLLKKFASKIGNLLHKDMIEKINSMNNDIIELRNDFNKEKYESERREAENTRIHILRFGDEILHGIRHTQDHFEQILLEIKKYQDYCNEHPNFPNGVTEFTTKRIKEVYQKLLETGDFLQ